MRIERDSLGEFEVPAEAKYGVHSMRAYKNFFISGVPVSEFPELVIALAQVKKAAAAANTKLGVLDAEKARAIQDACDEIIGGAHHDQIRERRANCQACAGARKVGCRCRRRTWIRGGWDRL